MSRRASLLPRPAGPVAALLGSASPAAAEIAPPWCGTPEPDAAEALPSTGTSFPASRSTRSAARSRTSSRAASTAA